MSARSVARRRSSPRRGSVRSVGPGRGVLRPKTAAEVDAMAASGALVVAVHRALAAAVAPGVTTDDLDALAVRTIADAGATSSFLGHQGFPKSICASVNDEVVHGIPSGRTLVDGDLVSLDVGVILAGWHGDAAWTYPVGTITEDARRLLDGTVAALDAAVAACVAGGAVADVGAAIERMAAEYGLGVVPDFGGHGIGRSMWEEPHVANRAGQAVSVPLVAGMTLAVEPMLSLGEPDYVEAEDGWTIRTLDRSLAAHVEHDIAVMPEGEPPRVLTAGLGARQDQPAVGVLH
jgi:methionyl aminopeptidase